MYLGDYLYLIATHQARRCAFTYIVVQLSIRVSLFVCAIPLAITDIQTYLLFKLQTTLYMYRLYM